MEKRNTRFTLRLDNRKLARVLSPQLKGGIPTTQNKLCNDETALVELWRVRAKVFFEEFACKRGMDFDGRLV
jgi:hypothetical protein